MQTLSEYVLQSFYKNKTREKDILYLEYESDNETDSATEFKNTYYNKLIRYNS